MAQFDNFYNIADLREAARRRLPKAVFEFIDRGTEDEVSLAENRAAFKQSREGQGLSGQGVAIHCALRLRMASPRTRYANVAQTNSTAVALPATWPTTNSWRPPPTPHHGSRKPPCG